MTWGWRTALNVTTYQDRTILVASLLLETHVLPPHLTRARLLCLYCRFTSTRTRLDQSQQRHAFPESLRDDARRSPSWHARDAEVVSRSDGSAPPKHREHIDLPSSQRSHTLRHLRLAED